MLNKLAYSFALLLLASVSVIGQSRTMYVGDVELRLGMPRDAAMRALSKYKLETLRPTSFAVMRYDERKKLFDLLGSIGFEGDSLSFINRNIDTSGWPNDEGFSVGRAIYDALGGAIPITDTDGAKRGNARIVIDNQDVAQPTRGNLRNILIFLNESKISVSIWDGADGRNVTASVAIRSKPW